MEQSLKKIALVTETSTRSGEISAIRLIEAGFRVYGTSRRPKPTRMGDEFVTVSLDPTESASVLEAVEFVLARAGRIDLLVNHLGVRLVGGFEESSAAQVLELFHANLFSVMQMTTAVLPIMRLQGKGRIVNVTSVQGRTPSPLQSIYSATKHALEGYSRSLDHEVRGQGVRVVLVESDYAQDEFRYLLSAPDGPMEIYDDVKDAMRCHVWEPKNRITKSVDLAAAIVRAATARNPTPRYFAGLGVRGTSMLQSLMPSFMYQRQLRKGSRANER